MERSLNVINERKGRRMIPLTSKVWFLSYVQTLNQEDCNYSFYIFIELFMQPALWRWHDPSKPGRTEQRDPRLRVLLEVMQPNLYALLVEYTKLKIEHTKRWYKNRFDRQSYELLRLATICRLQTWWWNVYCLCGNFPLLHNSNIARVTIDECTPHFEWCLRLMSANWRHPPPFRWWNKDQACADKPRLLSQIVATK